MINKYRKESYKGSTLQEGTYEDLIYLTELNECYNILEVGCGNGELGRIGKDLDLTGMDLNVSKKRLEGYHRVYKGDIERKTRFKDNEFGTVISVSVFQFLDKFEEAFKECLRIAEYEVIINVPNSKLYPYTGFNYIDKKVLINLGKKFGLKTKIFYLSNKLDFIRSLWGNRLSGGLIAIYKK